MSVPTEGRRLVDRNLPNKLMVRVGRDWIAVDVTDWKSRLAKAIDRRLARILSRCQPMR